MLFCTIVGYKWFGSSRRCSAGSKKIFLNKQSETCQKGFALQQTLSSYEKIWKSQKRTFRVYISQFDAYFVIFCTVLGYKCFGSSRRCSAGSKKNFLNKQSETCQKGFELQQTLSSYEKIWKFKKSLIWCIYLSFLYDYLIFLDHLWVSVFWIQQKELCGIQENVS